MLTMINGGVKREYNEGGIWLPYHCENGAAHDYNCCDTCWNRHPNPMYRFGGISTEKMSERLSTCPAIKR